MVGVNGLGAVFVVSGLCSGRDGGSDMDGGLD